MKNLILLLTLIAATVILGSLFSCSDNSVENNYDPPKIDPQSYPCPYQEPSVSFDGKKIVFYRNKIVKIAKSGYNVETDTDSTGFWICNIDGSKMEMIYNNSVDIISNPQFTPDMKELVFVKNAQICKTKYTGELLKENDIIQLTNDGRNFFPSVSPNGELIVFDSNKDSPNGMNFIWKMNIDGASKTRIAYEPEVGEIRMPYWSANDQILHLRSSQDYSSTEIFQITPDGLNIKRITFNETTDTYPRYSFKKNKIAYTSQAEGTYPQICIIDSTKKISQLTINGVYSNCSWTADNKIVYVHYSPFNYDVNNGTIWIMNSDGGNKKQITFNYGLQLE